ncbi:MAG: response regulator [Candidatus Aminicenantes bacterium]|nr:response regulator [Candidatus Aminicenantes bacterium]
MDSFWRKKILFFSLFFFSLLARFSTAQYWLTHHYTEINGLPTSFVNDIIQDHLGRMWMATRSGISCCDGVSWDHHNESTGLPFLSISRIRADSQGRIWALPDMKLAAGLPILFLEDNSWQQTGDLKDTFPGINKITSFQLFEHTGKIAVLVGTDNIGVLWWEKGKWKKLSVKDGLLSDSVNGIAILNEKCYVATDMGLSVINKDRKIDNRLNDFINFPVSRRPVHKREIKGICVEESGENPGIWFFGQGFLGYFSEDSKKPVYFDTGIGFGQKEELVKLLPDYRSGIYVGNIYELFYFNRKTEETQRLSVSNGLLGVGVNTMLNDFEKNIWLACDRGVAKIASRRFDSLTMVHGLLEDEVTAVLEYEPGKFVLGHNNGLTFYDGSRFRKLPFFPDNDARPRLCRVLEIKADLRQNIWVASSHMGLAKIDRNMNIRWYNSKQGLPDKISSLWIDGKNNVWMGTPEGIFCLQPDGRISKKTGGFPESSFRKIFGEKGKLRYLATHSSGLYVYTEQGRWENYRSGGAERENSVYAVKKDSGGRLLVGTAAGLYMLSQGALTKFKVRDFKINRPVYFIVEDNKKRLWFGTDNGVIRWDGTRDIRYSIPEGLVGQETNRAAGIIDSSGKIWIGTNRGVSIYHEALDNYNTWNPPPKVRLLELEANNRKFSLGQPIKLSYKTRRLVFAFRGISFLDEKAIRFKHKLEGFDKQWSKEQYHYYQLVEYTTPRPGTYRFLIKAKNAMGVWSDIVSSSEIIILEPYYNKWWFYLLMLFCSGLVFYGFFHFITTRRSAAMLEKLVEERTGQLQATEKRYRDLFEGSLDMVFISTKDGKFLDINPIGVDLLGYPSKEEIMAVDISKDIYYSPENRAIFLKEIGKKGFVKDYELILKKKEGEKITVLLTASVVADKKGDIGAISGIIRDITEKKKLQQQLEQSQKMEAIGTLAGGIAHDFNNILGVISGYLDLTIDELEKDTTVRQNIEQVIASTNRAKDLVKQILAFSRQDSRELKPLRIGIIIREALKLLRSTLPATIEIRQGIEPDSDIVLAEPTQIHQVIMNLCTNAAFAMRETGGILDVSLREVQLDEESAAAYNHIKPGRYFRLSVGDTGHGIEPALLKRIFDPYFTTKKPGEGTGMGLAVIHGIVKSLSGEITVYSEPGQGATFHVLLPTAEETAEEAIEQETGEQGEDALSGKGERILLVDDEPLLVVVGQRLLELLNYRVTTATNGIEALEIFKSRADQFDLVITDYTMPKMTGLQLSKGLKKIRPGIPIILCTGFSETVTADHIKGLGIQKLLIKPIDRKGMAQAIREALKKDAPGKSR